MSETPQETAGSASTTLALDARLNERMRWALVMLHECDDPDAAITVTQPSRRIQPFGRGPKSAFMNLRTARALRDLGLLKFSGGDIEPTYEHVSLTDTGHKLATLLLWSGAMTSAWAEGAPSWFAQPAATGSGAAYARTAMLPTA